MLRGTWLQWVKVEWCEILFGAHLHVCIETGGQTFHFNLCCIADFHKMCALINPPPHIFPSPSLFTSSLWASPFSIPISSTSSALHIQFFPPPQLYMYQLFHSLAYIHANGVCHWDIKPQILLLNPQDWHLETMQFWQVGFYLPFLKQAVKLMNQFPFSSVLI